MRGGGKSQTKLNFHKGHLQTVAWMSWAATELKKSMRNVTRKKVAEKLGKIKGGRV